VKRNDYTGPSKHTVTFWYMTPNWTAAGRLDNQLWPVMVNVVTEKQTCA